MTIDVEKIGREVVDRLLKEANSNIGPCFFPGVFKPPHKGDFEAAKYLSSKEYINRVYIVVSNVSKFGLTAQDSVYIWNQYLEADPDPKIKLLVSKESSPVKDVYTFIKDHPQVDPIYVAAESNEVEGEGGYGSLQKNFGDRAKIEIIPAQYTKINAEDMLSAAQSGDYESLKDFIPNVAYNKGAGKNVFAALSTIQKKSK